MSRAGTPTGTGHGQPTPVRHVLTLGGRESDLLRLLVAVGANQVMVTSAARKGWPDLAQRAAHGAAAVAAMIRDGYTHREIEALLDGLRRMEEK